MHASIMQVDATMYPTGRSRACALKRFKVGGIGMANNINNNSMVVENFSGSSNKVHRNEAFFDEIFQINRFRWNHANLARLSIH